MKATTIVQRSEDTVKWRATPQANISTFLNIILNADSTNRKMALMASNENLSIAINPDWFTTSVANGNIRNHHPVSHLPFLRTPDSATPNQRYSARSPSIQGLRVILNGKRKTQMGCIDLCEKEGESILEMGKNGG